jgi:hypothetical protein
MIFQSSTKQEKGKTEALVLSLTRGTQRLAGPAISGAEQRRRVDRRFLADGEVAGDSVYVIVKCMMTRTC